MEVDASSCPLLAVFVLLAIALNKIAPEEDHGTSRGRHNGGQARSPEPQVERPGGKRGRGRGRERVIFIETAQTAAYVEQSTV